MKVKLGHVFKFSLNANLGVEYFEKVAITSFLYGGKTLHIQSASTSEYNRVLVNGKYLWMRKENAQRFVSANTPNICTPGSILKLWHNEDYCVSATPEKDEWSGHEIYAMVNTYLLRKTLIEAKETNLIALQLISAGDVSAASSTFCSKQIVPLTKLLEAFDTILEQTAVNF